MLSLTVVRQNLTDLLALGPGLLTPRTRAQGLDVVLRGLRQARTGDGADELHEAWTRAQDFRHLFWAGTRPDDVETRTQLAILLGKP